MPFGSLNHPARSTSQLCQSGPTIRGSGSIAIPSRRGLWRTRPVPTPCCRVIARPFGSATNQNTNRLSVRCVLRALIRSGFAFARSAASFTFSKRRMRLPTRFHVEDVPEIAVIVGPFAKVRRNRNRSQFALEQRLVRESFPIGHQNI